MINCTETLEEFLRRFAESLDLKYKDGVIGRPALLVLSREQIESYKQTGIIPEKKGNDHESF